MVTSKIFLLDIVLWSRVDRKWNQSVNDMQLNMLNITIKITK